MENRTPHTSGRPVQGEESNHPQSTTSCPRSQAAERLLLPLLITTDRMIKEVVA
jgi:hypothetical protein